MSKDNADFTASVLIIGSNHAPHAQLADLLPCDRYQVTHSDDGLDALRKIKSQRFDLAITGVLMVGMDGLELLRIIHETMPDLPVIVVGDAKSDINEVYLRCAESLGATQTHKSPLDAKIFLDDVQNVIRQSRAKLAGRKSYNAE